MPPWRGLLLTSSFPRLLIAMFSSQMRSYTKLLFNAQDRQSTMAVRVYVLDVAVASAVPQEAAASLPAAATEFVQLIQSRAGSPSAVAVTFQNVSSVSPERQEALQNAIFNAFRNANVRVVKPEQAVAEVHITFSEDWQGYLLIASVQQGSTNQTVIKKLPRQQQMQSAHATTLTIRKISVWQQETPILDFYQDNQNLLVLEPSQLALTQWTLDNGVRGRRWESRTRSVAARSAREAGGSRRRTECLSSWRALQRKDFSSVARLPRQRRSMADWRRAGGVLQSAQEFL